MPNYAYKARNIAGKLITGTLEAESPRFVAQILQNRSQIPISIEPVKENSDLVEKIAYWRALRNVGINELILFSRQMHSLTKAGVPLIRGILSLADSTRNIAMKQALLNIANRLEAGQTLSQSLSQHPNIFPILMISVISIGETTGGLDESFKQIGNYLAREKETTSRVKSAFRYPIMVMAAITIAMVIVNIYVIPAFKGVFEKLGSELPWQTQLLMSISSFTLNYWHYLLGAVVAVFLIFSKFISTPAGKQHWHWLLLKIPLLGDIIIDAAMERFCRSFAMVMQAGVPLIQGIAIVANSVGNDYIAHRLQRMRIGIEKGDSISRMAKNIGLFPGLVVQMLLVGEESGNLSDMLMEAAEFYEDEIDALLKNLSSAIEPILIIVIGMMVLVLALGIFLPMWNLSSAMQ